MRALNPDQLLAFRRVVELGSFSAAAKRLNLTQPAVSQQIRQLEERLGLRLIERVGRRAMPTNAGSELLVHARNIDCAMEAAVEAMDEQARGAMGRVRIGTGSTALIYLLPPLLRDLKRRFPTLEITVSTGNTIEMLQQIEANLIDIGLVTLPPKANSAGRAFAVTPLLEEEFVAVESGEGSRCLPVKVTPAALAALPLVLDEPNSQSWHVLEDWFRRGGQRVKPAMALGSVEAIKEVVCAGLGCGILPRSAVTGNGGKMSGGSRRSGAPLRFRSLTPPLYRRLGLVMRRDKVLHRGLRETVKVLMRLQRPAK